jgi:hypothetical protein
MNFFIAFAIIVAFTLIGLHAYRRLQNMKASAAIALDAHVVTDAEVKQAIRTDVAPQNRPYGNGGVKTDSSGRTYAIATDGSVRRFAVGEKPNGEMDVVLVKKPGKALRKAAKRAKRQDRGIIVQPIHAPRAPLAH